MRTLAIVAVAVVFAAPTTGLGQALPARVRVYDGDTFTATFRLETVDAPEIEGKCKAERDLARRARAFTSDWLARHAGEVTIRVSKVDRYGRPVARVEAEGEELGDALVRAGLARPWRGRREVWC